jgi:L-alanine-DL-glutamate epimerase-like enolase superfamily enzyme
MKIHNVNIWSCKFRLTEPYTIAYETIAEVENIFIHLDTDSGIEGYGCAAPDKAVTGETPSMVKQACKAVIEPALRGENPLLRSRPIEILKNQIPHLPAARAMVDMALYDILGKVAGLPLYQLLGGFRDRIKTSVTIPILPIPETIARAKHFKELGFTALKIKGGKEMDPDVERVIKVREAVGPEVELRFDANQGYTCDQALEFVKQTCSAGLELLEQPTSRKDIPQMCRVTRKIPVPVMADESLLNLKDALRIATDGLADMVNIKLMKVGGISEAIQIDSVARAAGLDSMVGCMDEAELAIAAGLHFALSRPNVTYADLDGHLYLENDPTTGCLTLRNGYLYPSELPGLGLDKQLNA